MMFERFADMVRLALRPGRKIYQIGATNIPPHDAPITPHLLQTSPLAGRAAKFVARLAIDP